MADEIVVSFHNSLLRESDLCLLDGPRWLNDKLIGFAFEYFEHTMFAGKVDNIAFISPEVTQFIKMSAESEVGLFVNPLDLPQKDYIFLAINNNSSYSSVGGSHWSLLVFEKEEQRFSHFDSNNKSNSSDAKQVVLQLQPLLTETGIANYVEVACRQQENGYDCGLFVVCFAEYLCGNFVNGVQELCVTDMANSVTQRKVTEKRKELRWIVEELANTATSDR